MSRYRKGKGLFIDYPTEAIIDEETGERYYDGFKPNYISSKEMVTILNQYEDEKKEFKSKILGVIDRKIKNNNSNPSKDCYYKVHRALKDVKESLRDVIEEY